MPFSSTLGGTGLPPWLRTITQGAAQRAEALSRRPFSPYNQPRVAGFGRDIERAHVMGREIRQTQPFFEESHRNARESQRGYPEAYQHYRNPHENDVVNRLIADTRRGFGEKTLPDIASHFVGSGHHGSSRHRDIALRSQREMENALASQVSQARAHGYESGHTMHLNDMDRRLRGAEQIAQLGSRRQASHLADIATLESQGNRTQQQQQRMLDIAYQEYLRENAFPGESLAQLIASLEGMPYSQSTYSVAHNAPPAPPPRVNNLGQIGALAGQLLSAGMGRGGNR